MSRQTSAAIGTSVFFAVAGMWPHDRRQCCSLGT
jgi:hypothetical protein